MNRFSFRLQRVLRLRQQQERQAALELALALQQLDEASRARLRHEEMLLQARRTWEEERSGQPAKAWRQSEMWLGRLDFALRTAQGDERRARSESEERRGYLLQQSQEADVVERLEERLRRQWTTEYGRWQQAEIDQAALLQYARALATRRGGEHP